MLYSRHIMQKFTYLYFKKKIEILRPSALWHKQSSIRKRIRRTTYITTFTSFDPLWGFRAFSALLRFTPLLVLVSRKLYFLALNT